MEERRNLHVRLSVDARRALFRTAAEHGITVTALIEAYGRLLDQGDEPAETLVDLARRIDFEHRSRNRD